MLIFRCWREKRSRWRSTPSFPSPPASRTTTLERLSFHWRIASAVENCYSKASTAELVATSFTNAVLTRCLSCVSKLESKPSTFSTCWLRDLTRSPESSTLVILKGKFASLILFFHFFAGFQKYYLEIRLATNTNFQIKIVVNNTWT